MNPFLRFVYEQDYFSKSELSSFREIFIIRHWDEQKLNLNRSLSNLNFVQDEIGKLRERLVENNTVLGLWKSSEMFLLITNLFRARTPQELLIATDLIKNVFDRNSLPYVLSPPYLRSNGYIYKECLGKMEDVTDKVSCKSLFDLFLIYPTPCLFNDLFQSEDTVSSSLIDNSPEDYDFIKNIVEKALILITSYSKELIDDFLEIVSSIACLSVNSNSESLNFGPNYYGTIFLNPYKYNECYSAALLIHEYLHLCSWLLWSIVKPTGKPQDHVYLKSPMTGNLVRASCLCDAMMIYVSNSDFFEWCSNEHNITPEIRNFSKGRNKLLKRQIPRLYRLLCHVVQEGTEYRKFIDFSMNYHFRRYDKLT